MIRTILMPVDNLDRAEVAVRHVAAIATTLGAQVTILGIISYLGGVLGEQFTDPVTWQVMKSESISALGELVQYLEVRHIDAQLDVLDAPAAEALVHYQADNGFDLIVLAAGEADLTPLILSLLDHSNIPILLARPQPSEQCAHILVPLDGSQRAECVLPLAITLAQAGNGKLLFTHVIHKPEMPRRTAPSAEDADLAQRLIERNKNEAECYLNDLVSRVPVEAEARLLIDDSITTALHQMVEREQVDLVMVCAHGYTGRPQWPLGSIASNLVRYCPISMIVVQDLPTSVQQSQAEISRGKNRAT